MRCFRPATLAVRNLWSGIALAAIVAATTGLSLAATPAAYALSEIKREELPAPTVPPTAETDNPENAVPLPDPIEPSTPGEPDKTGPTTPEATPAPAEPADQANEPVDPNAPLPEVIYDFSRLPPEVKRLRDQILDACRSGEPERLRPLLGLGDDETQLSLGAIDGDPIDFLKSLAGDADGLEILAIMEEVLNSGYVHLDAGTPEELYVWPYFFAVPLERLTAAQRVELFKIITAGDYEEMKSFGSYIFYRVGITPAGKWAFFVAGE